MEHKPLEPVLEIAQALESSRLSITALDDGSGVVLDAVGEQLLSMNATGLTIMRAIANGAHDTNALVDHLAARFAVDRQTAEADVTPFVERVAATL
ncbi:MAG: PqqD family protein [Wenzhouxiangella sp.]